MEEVAFETFAKKKKMVTLEHVKKKCKIIEKREQ